MSLVTGHTRFVCEHNNMKFSLRAKFERCLQTSQIAEKKKMNDDLISQKKKKIK